MMPKNVIDYGSPAHRLKPGVSAGVCAIAGSVVILNVLLVIAVVTDGPRAGTAGWADLIVLVALGPLANGWLLLALAACSPLFKRLFGGASVLPYLLSAFVLPTVAYVILNVWIRSRMH